MRTFLLPVALSFMACPAIVDAAPLPEATLDVVWKASERPIPVGLATVGADAFVLFAGAWPNSVSLRNVNAPDTIMPVAVEGEARGLSAGDGRLYASANVDRSYFPQDLLSEAPHTDMSVAQLSTSGDVIWQVNLGQPGWQTALEVAALPTDGAVVLGADYGRTILVWNVDGTGKTRWAHSFEETTPGDIAILPSGGIAILGTEGSGPPENYNEDVMLWLLNPDGAIAKAVNVRKAINSKFGNLFFQGSMVVTKDSIVVATEWPDRFGQWQPLQISSFDLDGAPRWQTPVGNVSCAGSLFAEAGGDVLLACKEPALTEGLPYFDLTRFDGATGEPTSERLAVPACSDKKYWLRVEIAATNGDRATLVGMQPIPDSKSSCSWIGRADLPPHH